MKNLANCTPREFLRQTNRIRRAAARWLKLTDILNIRGRVPAAEREDALWAQAMENINAMLEAMLEKYPDETAELLGLMCFIEPEELEQHTMRELLGAFSELIGCPEVAGFFTALARLGRTAGSGAAGM